MSALNAIVARTRARLASEEAGFTLIELLNVLMILGILMSISFSTYTTLHKRAEEKAAMSNVAAILPAVHAWRADHADYTTMTIQQLNDDYLNGSLDITYYDVGGTPSDTAYCVQYTNPTNDYTAKAVGPGDTITVGPGNVC